MADALIGGLIAAGHTPSAISVTEPDAARAEALQAQHGVRVLQPGDDVAHAELVVLAVKPQQLQEALSATPLAAGTTVLSIAAGVRCAQLRRHLPEEVRLVRSMPNTPARVAAGITGLYAEDGAGDDARAQADYIMRAVGDTVWLGDEDALDVVTALSGSGPAYVFALTEAMTDAGCTLGLPADTAEKLARQTVIGAGCLMAAEPVSAGTLRQRVTSPGGTTAAALSALEDGGFAQLLLKAVRAARERAEALSGDASSTDSASPRP